MNLRRALTCGTVAVLAACASSTPAPVSTTRLLESVQLFSETPVGDAHPP
ncbi:MAG: hypothetical protein JNK75_07225, partial [Betaproteobacteria bacterium]|nr:hypothetical protein [Betaproteobacteria bacterium]